jgi:hypothetical protein
MAVKTKPIGKLSDAKKAIARLEKATKELQLDIKRLKDALPSTMFFFAGPSPKRKVQQKK